jgi:hypothetical protein
MRGGYGIDQIAQIISQLPQATASKVTSALTGWFNVSATTTAVGRMVLKG